MATADWLAAGGGATAHLQWRTRSRMLRTERQRQISTGGMREHESAAARGAAQSERRVASRLPLPLAIAAASPDHEKRLDDDVVVVDSSSRAATNSAVAIRFACTRTRSSRGRPRAPRVRVCSAWRAGPPVAPSPRYNASND